MSHKSHWHHKICQQKKVSTNQGKCETKKTWYYKKWQHDITITEKQISTNQGKCEKTNKSKMQYVERSTYNEVTHTNLQKKNMLWINMMSAQHITKYSSACCCGRVRTHINDSKSSLYRLSYTT